MNSAFIKGMDISSYPEMLDMGYRYFDFDGNEVDLLDFAVSQGFNYGRLRIWNEPKNVPEAKGYCDLEHTKCMAWEIKKRGMGFLLDFHYSDWYADPARRRNRWHGKGLIMTDLYRRFMILRSISLWSLTLLAYIPIWYRLETRYAVG